MLEFHNICENTDILKTRRTKTIDILSTGELLVDFISTDFVDSMDEASNFKRIAGGSPANLCMNMARLGNKTALVARVGKDDIGQFLTRKVRSLGVDTTYLQAVDMPTTLILVTRSKTVSNFEAYRGADKEILATQFPDEVLKNSRIFHTTCFGLSLEPAQSTILAAAKKAVDFGTQLSIDANYAQKIWRNRAKAQAIVADYCSHGALVKISEVDWERLYESPFSSREQVGEYFLNLGAKEVCLTLGSEGCFVMNADTQFFLESRPVEVRDTTGAGDAFWSGYLTAWLDGATPQNCAIRGRSMAEYKLGHFGELPDEIVL